MVDVACFSSDREVEPNIYHSMIDDEERALLLVYLKTEEYIGGLFGKTRVSGVPPVFRSGLIYPLALPDGDMLFEGSPLHLF